MIDNALRSAAFDRGIEVKLMCSQWRYSKKDMFAYLQSLLAFGEVLKRKNGSLEVVGYYMQCMASLVIFA